MIRTDVTFYTDSVTGRLVYRGNVFKENGTYSTSTFNNHSEALWFCTTEKNKK
jgi:hypothetical protein